MTTSAPVAAPRSVKSPALVAESSVIPENSLTLPVTATLSPTAGAIARPPVKTKMPSAASGVVSLAASWPAVCR